MTRLFLIAHASTRATEQARFPCDESVSERGRRELGRVAVPVVDRWVCAPERRAVDTVHAFGVPAEIDSALRELDYGRWCGAGLDELPESDLAMWLTEPASAPHGGESVEDLICRIGTWLAAQDDSYERVGVVTHPAVVRAATVCALDAPASSFRRVDVGPLDVVRLYGGPGRWTLRPNRFARRATR
ncbi:histidine phosphatase family protein [Rhodococcus pyridinivorans]|uniref:histidine phosphatase family protein n=1 Tax=Rhodococcus pyridinivorans TaxID=103816 RepID=UPI002283B775|nr:histidine phosphatase family protein [Rhodococcus pyridinivorans]WAL45635.1 histidine phosphatase family protein [Rhodococcus pyridinivorans]